MRTDWEFLCILYQPEHGVSQVRVVFQRSEHVPQEHQLHRRKHQLFLLHEITLRPFRDELLNRECLSGGFE